MVSKFSWILFIPLTIAAVFLKLAQVIMPEGAIMGLNNLKLDYIVIGCAALVFVASLIFCLVDRKISQYYLAHRNYAAGILGLLLAVVCAADGANNLYNSFSSGNIDAMTIVEAVLLLLTSVVFIALGLSHSFKNSDNHRLALFNVMPALLCAIRLVRSFIKLTTVSMMDSNADVCLLFCYIFAMMFFFNFAVTISLTEAKHAVKSCFIFGFPAVTMLLAYGSANLFSEFNTENIFSNAPYFEIILMGLYIFAFLLELTIFIKDRDHVVIAGAEEDYQELDDSDTEIDESFVVTGLDDDDRLGTPESYLAVNDVEGYIYQEQEQETSDEAPTAQGDNEGYITEVVDRPNDHDPDPNRPGYTDRLDEIDQLILELSGDVKLPEEE